MVNAWGKGRVGILLDECQSWRRRCEGRVVDPGVLGPFGAENGPVWVGVMARVEAAMRRSYSKDGALGVRCLAAH